MPLPEGQAVSLTPAQRQLAQAYASVFSPGDATQTVLDDLQGLANGFPIEHQAGAARLLLYMLSKATALRRDKMREKR